MSDAIPFNIPYVAGREIENLEKTFSNRKFCGDGAFTKKCHDWLSSHLSGRRNLLTTSCTHALEMSALLSGISAGDEVIMPSFTFVSTANAFVLRGAKIVFVDIRPDTMNLDETLLEAAVTSKTRAIVPVHYAGVSCEMKAINELAKSKNIKVIEDAAQCIGSTYKGSPVGSFSDFSAFSFHETKNIHCGEGGAISISSLEDFRLAEIIREKGTDRSQFIRNQVDKYTWQNIGSSYLPSEFNAAVLIEQLANVDSVTSRRKKLWQLYLSNLHNLEKSGKIEIPKIPKDCGHNGHIFWIKARDHVERNLLIEFLRVNKIQSAFHYIPLHSSPAGQKFGIFSGTDRYSSRESERLLRLPLFFSLQDTQVNRVCEAIENFYLDR